MDFSDKGLHEQFQLYAAVDCNLQRHSGDKDALLKEHDLKLQGGGWANVSDKSLNNVSVTHMYHILLANNQYLRKLTAGVIMKEKPDGAKLTAEQAAAVFQWFAHFPYDKPYFLKKHQDMLAHKGWSDDSALNSISVDDLGLALYYGYTRT